jgi:hypothetical protein
MKILALEHDLPGATPDKFKPLLKAEAARVWDLYLAGILREAYFRADRSEAVLVLECPSAAEAREILETLPLAQAGLIAFEVLPLIPYPGFARLFDQENPLALNPSRRTTGRNRRITGGSASRANSPAAQVEIVMRLAAGSRSTVPPGEQTEAASIQALSASSHTARNKLFSSSPAISASV